MSERVRDSADIASSLTSLVRSADEAYRALHAIPELSMTEYATSDFIVAQLRKMGLEPTRITETGSVVVLENGPGPTVAFRADIDGLAIEELTGAPYASSNTDLLDGARHPTMHACGHDAHVACALALVQFFRLRRDLWNGTLVFIFQPGEEDARGAQAMLAAGLWDKVPVPGVVLAQHVGPFQAGTVETRAGDASSLADSLSIEITAVGAHASRPADSPDPIAIGAYLVAKLQTIVSRRINPQQAVVVTISTFHAGTGPNVIPSSATMTMNIRTPNEATRGKVLALIDAFIAAERLAEPDAGITVRQLSSFPANVNDAHWTHVVGDGIAAVIGASNVSLDRPQTMASEDFGLLAAAIDVPSVMWWFGAYRRGKFRADKQLPVNHSPYFLPDRFPTLIGGIVAGRAAILRCLRELGGAT